MYWTTPAGVLIIAISPTSYEAAQIDGATNVEAGAGTVINADADILTFLPNIEVNNLNDIIGGVQ